MTISHQETPCQLTPVAPGEIHVWRIYDFAPGHADQPMHKPRISEELRHKLLNSLTEDEKRAKHTTIAKGALRYILSGYLKIPPTEIQFQSNDHGKPYLPYLPYLNENLFFNLSHSKNLALAAFSSDREIGIDIEFMSRSLQLEQIAQRFFSVAEWEALRGYSSEAERALAFYTTWVRKEAIVKAFGEGIAHHFKNFSVIPKSTLNDRFKWDVVSLSGKWAYRELAASELQLAPDSGYLAAIATKLQKVDAESGTIFPTLRFFDFPQEP